MKTVFIIASQALIIRNVLRSGTLEELVRAGHRVVILLAAKEVPQYVRDELENDQVSIVSVPELPVGKLHRQFIKCTHYLIWNRTTKRYFRYSTHFVNRSRVESALHICLLRAASALGFALRPLVRFLETSLFKETHGAIQELFDKHKPDLVFSTSITSKIDNKIMKEARRRGITTIAMPKSWDNVTKMYLRFVPDYFIVQNNILKERLSTLQDFPEKRVFVSGFPQFDWYRRPGIIRSREDHFKKLGLDPALPMIFFGSQGQWFKDDYRIAEYIYSWIQNHEFVKDSQLLVRPHYTNVRTTPLRRFKGRPLVALDETFKISEAFSDNWDPTEPEIIDFVNTLYHSDVVVIILSTIALDAACFDKPIINAAFGAKYRNGKDITPEMKSTEHYQWVLKTNATSVAHTPEELKSFINAALMNPDEKKEQRKVLRENVCYMVDGKASERIAHVLLSALNDTLE